MKKIFNLHSFSADLKTARKDKTMEQFSKEMKYEDISSLKECENGIVAPNKDLLDAFCKYSGKSCDYYWSEEDEDIPMGYLMGNIGSDDKDAVEDIMNKIAAYEYLFAQFKRVSNEK